MKKFLSSFLFLILGINLPAQEWESTRVLVSPEGLVYPSDPNMNRIPDFSYAGYEGGGAPIPQIETKVSIQPIAGDNTAHIQQALDRVAALPPDSLGFRGAVLLSAGTYEVWGSIYINNDGIVLRGAGDGEDPDRNSILIGRGNNPAKRAVIVAGGGKNTRWEGRVSGSRTNIITDFVQVGASSFQVENALPYEVGDNIIVHHPATKEWMEAIGQQHWEVGKYNIRYNRNITRIEGNTIFLDVPVYNHLDRSLSQAYIYKYDREGLRTRIGIEDLRVEIDHTGEREAHARNAVVLRQIEHAWVRNSSFLHFVFSGVLTETASFITVENCRALEPKGLPKGGRFYNFNAGDASNNILFKNNLARGARHAFVANGTSEASGIVVYRSISVDPLTSSEGHRHWTTGMLFDNFRDQGKLPSSDGGRVLGFYNRGDYGTWHGWTNAHSVIWNSDLRRGEKAGKAVIQAPRTGQNYAIGSFGIFTGEGPFPGEVGHLEGIGKPLLKPASLYKAQLEARMAGKQPVFPPQEFLQEPVRDIFDYPLIFRERLFLKEEGRNFGGYSLYNEAGEKVEENEKGAAGGLGKGLAPGIYTLHIVLDGRIVERKLIKL